MKKVFSLFVVLILLSLLSPKTYSQTGALYLNGGYGWSKGVLGAEWRAKNLGLGFGWFPTKMPMSGNPVSSLSLNFSIYSIEPGDVDSGWYLTIAGTSAGYRSESSSGYSVTQPMTILTLGYIMDVDYFTLSAGGGYGWSSGYGGSWTAEVTLGIRVFELW